MNQLIKKLAEKGALPSDDEDTKLKKAILILISLGIAILAIFWGALYALSGYPFSGAIPLSYAAISFSSIYIFVKTKKFEFFRFSQFFIIIILPFLLMWSLGGFANGSVVIVWAFFTPLAALFFADLQAAFRWLVFYIALTIISGFVDPYVVEFVKPMPPLLNNIYFVMNMGAGFGLIYIVIQYFVKDREASHKAATRAKELALQSKNELEKAYQQLQANELRIRELMLTDALTGVANRRNLDERLTIELERSKRYGNSISLIMTDIDHFKKFNDVYGHSIGDTVLKHFSKIIKDSIRSSDFVARFGGEEFLILLPETTIESAIHLAERIRHALESSKIEGIKDPLTASFGVTGLQEQDTQTSVFERVDKALYKSKENGRNQVTSLL